MAGQAGSFPVFLGFLFSWGSCFPDKQFLVDPDFFPSVGCQRHHADGVTGPWGMGSLVDVPH